MKNVKIAGTNYNNVPSIDIPLQTSGVATFYDISDTTAEAADVASGKYFYTSAGVKTEGTSSGGGKTPVEPKQINFLDYDGTILYSYTAPEFANLSALPPNPSHTGLTAQGWNWTKAEITTQLAEAPGGNVEVGQSYVTDDNKTRLYIYIEDTAKASELTFYVCFSASVVGGITIDWGDGNTETNTATTATVYPHTYASRGYYVVTLQRTSGTYKLGNNSSYRIYGSSSNANLYNSYRIYKVELGGTGLSETNGYCFATCRRLKTITIPTTFTKFGDRIFQDCKAFYGCVIPRSLTNFGLLPFNGASSLKFVSYSKGNQVQRGGDSPRLERVTISNTLTSSAFYGNIGVNSVVLTSNLTAIPSQAFYNCSGITHLTIPATVTSIASEAFRGCPNILEYHFKPTTPPTLSNTNAFTSINTNCVFYVPYSADHSILTAYQTASNWSSYSSRFQEEPQ